MRDAAGGLEWTRDLQPAHDRRGAVTHCESLALPGHDDWRLPSAKGMPSALTDSRAELAVGLASGISTPVPNRGALLAHACVCGG